MVQADVDPPDLVTRCLDDEPVASAMARALSSTADTKELYDASSCYMYVTLINSTTKTDKLFAHVNKPWKNLLLLSFKSFAPSQCSINNILFLLLYMFTRLVTDQTLDTLSTEEESN